MPFCELVLQSHTEVGDIGAEQIWVTTKDSAALFSLRYVNTTVQYTVCVRVRVRVCVCVCTENRCFRVEAGQNY